MEHNQNCKKKEVRNANNELKTKLKKLLTHDKTTDMG